MKLTPMTSATLVATALLDVARVLPVAPDVPTLHAVVLVAGKTIAAVTDGHARLVVLRAREAISLTDRVAEAHAPTPLATRRR
jgi:hypothetical protein